MLPKLCNNLEARLKHRQFFFFEKGKRLDKKGTAILYALHNNFKNPKIDASVVLANWEKIKVLGAKCSW